MNLGGDTIQPIQFPKGLALNQVALDTLAAKEFTTNQGAHPLSQVCFKRTP